MRRVPAPGSYDDIKRLGASERRRVDSLIALTASADPFFAGTPGRRGWAEWFADLWSKHELQPGIHMRGIHYKFVSQSTPIIMPNGNPYENTTLCAQKLNAAARDARYLDLLPADAIVDRRNPAPRINVPDDDCPAEFATIAGTIETHEFDESYRAPTISLPTVDLICDPTINQRYHIEIWIEKSGADDILHPIGREYGINIASFVGEVSATACESLVKRAIASDKPVRIFHLTDFDPAGRSMPTAAAAKIDFIAKKSGCDLDIRLIPLALTPEQCIEYKLPRMPIKETEARGDTFEARFGAGATEVDALETLYPGVLHDILVAEIERYIDANLDDEVDAAISDVEAALSRMTAEVHDRHADEIAALDEQRSLIQQAFNQANNPARAAYLETVQPAKAAYLLAVEQAQAALDAALNVVRDKIVGMEQSFMAQAEPFIASLNAEIEQAAPDVYDFDWPEGAEADEGDDDPLYDSTRSYLDQIDRFKRHQGKDDIEITTLRFVHQLTCEVCGKGYTSVRRNSTTCGDECRRTRWLAEHPDYYRLRHLNNKKTGTDR